MPDPRVLLVDDEEQIRHMLRRVLERHNFHVVAEAENGVAAVAAVEQHHPDIVIMDLNMPLMNGIDASRAIKQTHQAVRVLFFSAYADESLKRSAEDAGAAGWILKGSKPQELLDALAALSLPGTSAGDPANPDTVTQPGRQATSVRSKGAFPVSGEWEPA